MAYRLKLPEDAHIHPVVHISQLKRCLGSNKVVMERLPAVADDGSPKFDLHELLNIVK